MKLILLPGNNAGNESWIRQVRDSLQDKFDGSYLQGYDHWSSGKPVIDLDAELQKLASADVMKDSYAVFGKSAGVVLALKGISEGKIHPRKCIFVGTPVYWCKQNSFPLSDWLEGYSVPTLFVQKTRDPAATFEFLKGYLAKRNVQKHTMVEMPGDDHDYAEIDELKRIITEYISK